MMPAPPAEQKVYTERAGDVGLLGGAINAPALYYLLAVLNNGKRETFKVTGEGPATIHATRLTSGGSCCLGKNFVRTFLLARTWDLTLSEERARRHLEEKGR